MSKEAMSDLMKQAQSMQSKLQEIQKYIETVTVEGVSGAGLVKATLTGRHFAKQIYIDPKLIEEAHQDSNKKEVLEDLLCAAFNDAVNKIEKVSREQMVSLASGLKLPPEDKKT